MMNRARIDAELRKWAGEVAVRARRLPRWAQFAIPGGLLALLVMFGIVVAGGEGLGNAPTTEVARGPLLISVVESGTVRPRQQIVLRNEMDDPATIVSIVAEGERVKQGDLLVELDATEVETELVERRIRVQNSEAELIFARENFAVVKNQAEADVAQAELDLQFARQDLEKYLEGDYPKQLKELQAAITVAEQELEQAEEELRWSRILFEEKYLSQSDLQQDQLAADKVRLDVELAREELSLVRDYTHQRELAELESAVRQAEMALDRETRKATANIAEAEARLRYREAEHEEELARLQRFETELERSRIYAPIDGMVIYASSVQRNRWRRNDEPIEEGATVDERGEIIYLPTADAYNVDISIPEVNLEKVRPGMGARIRVDALAGGTLTGRVASISQLPDSESQFLNPNLKLYNAVIEVASTDLPLRSGMSCRVEIIVDHFDDAIYVPIQTVVQEDGEPVVYIVHGGDARPIEVELGLDNNRVVQILSGLTAGQSVLLNPPLNSGRPPAIEDLLELEERPLPGDEPESDDPPAVIGASTKG